MFVTFASWGATSLEVNAKPVSGSSTAAPKTTPSTRALLSIKGAPEEACFTVPLIEYTSRETIVVR